MWKHKEIIGLNIKQKLKQILNHQTLHTIYMIHEPMKNTIRVIKRTYHYRNLV